MIPDMSINKFLELMSTCTGDQAIDIITMFQCGDLCIGGFSVHDFEDRDND